jgi:hypothetical protein
MPILCDHFESDDSWGARVPYCNHPFACVEHDGAGGLQVRFLCGPRHQGPYPVASLERAEQYLSGYARTRHDWLSRLASPRFRMPLPGPKPELTQEQEVIAARVAEVIARQRRPKRKARR